jgi:hypothetical protein
MRVQDQKVANQSYMAPFQRENQLVQTQKKKRAKKESS